MSLKDRSYKKNHEDRTNRCTQERHEKKLKIKKEPKEKRFDMKLF